MRKPIIGLTLDSRGIGGYSERYPWYAVRKNYTQAINLAGGIPIALPHHLDQVDQYVDLIDGLLITGGGVDVSPSLYGEEEHHPSVTINKERTEFEIELVGAMASRLKPCLGICGGMQVMNVARGGSLFQDIQTQLPHALNHIQENDRHEFCHEVSILPETHLEKICEENKRIRVNSVHHQSVKTVGHGLTVNAVADDGVIEGIEDSQAPFFLGVQWHPEFHVTPHDKALLERFIIACQKH